MDPSSIHNNSLNKERLKFEILVALLYNINRGKKLMRIILKEDREKIKELYKKTPVMELAVLYEISPKAIVEIAEGVSPTSNLVFNEDLPEFNWGKFTHSKDWNELLQLSREEIEDIGEIWKDLNF